MNDLFPNLPDEAKTTQKPTVPVYHLDSGAYLATLTSAILDMPPEDAEVQSTPVVFNLEIDLGEDKPIVRSFPQYIRRKNGDYTVTLSSGQTVPMFGIHPVNNFMLINTGETIFNAKFEKKEVEFKLFGKDKTGIYNGLRETSNTPALVLLKTEKSSGRLNNSMTDIFPLPTSVKKLEDLADIINVAEDGKLTAFQKKVTKHIEEYNENNDPIFNDYAAFAKYILQSTDRAEKGRGTVIDKDDKSKNNSSSAGSSPAEQAAPKKDPFA